LLTPSEPTYDPWAWIIWGREIMHADLATVTGPSWKPLPVFFTTPFSLFGDAAAPQLWLVVARAGGLLAFAMAFRLAARLAGPVAGGIAAVALVLAAEFIRNFDRGNSEGLLVALCLWALERHLDGRRRDAFLLGLGAALLRPEVWPFIAAYGLWLVWQAWRAGDHATPGRRALPRAEILLVGVGGLALALLWFVPEYIGSGDFLRAAARARQPTPQSAAFADIPFVEVFHRSAGVLSGWVYAGGFVGVLIAARSWRAGRGRGLPLALAAVSTVLMIAVALMTQAGFAGNLRYVALPAALVCVLAGAGWVWLVRGTAARWGRRAGVAVAAAIALAAVPFVWDDVDSLTSSLRQVDQEYELYSGVADVVRKAGGPAKLRSCGQVYTGAFQVPAVAWHLHLHEYEVRIFPFAGGTAIGPRYLALMRDPRFTPYSGTRLWRVSSTCASRHATPAG
jgi:hypothetical protein